MKWVFIDHKKSFYILGIVFENKNKIRFFIPLSLEPLEPGIWRSPHRFWP